MAAHQTVPEVLLDSKRPKSIVPRHGVVTLFGFGIKVYVERGHLTVEDGIFADRRKARFSRVGHGLRRLVLIGSDGFVSLSALRWLVSQDASLLMLERDGKVLANTGPVHSSDARLRRAQSLAHQSGIALKIARELIFRKLSGQEKLAREMLNAPRVADSIAAASLSLAEAETIESVRQIEAQGANAYWSAWRNVPIEFPQRDIPRVPDHWLTFGTRTSPLTGSQRRASNPPNAILNYLYALLESESRLALTAMGLDPGIGVLHVDAPARDSFACDLMEAIRPQVDSYVFDWITHHQLRRNWFFEHRDGNCRLMASLATELSRTADVWGRAVAPIAEWIARQLWSNPAKPARRSPPATRLTQEARRKAKGDSPPPRQKAPVPPRLCRRCGKTIIPGRDHCASCGKEVSREILIEVAKLGRIAAHSPEAESLRRAARRSHVAALKAWKPSDKPDWLTEKVYREDVQPRLASLAVRVIASALKVSEPYSTEIRAGKRTPHPRHWLGLAKLAGVSEVGRY